MALPTCKVGSTWVTLILHGTSRPLNRITATGAYMRHRFSWASLELNNFANFCPFAMFDSSNCS
jgi:hypothetical protein